MRHYYDTEFVHVIDHHQDEIMDNIKKKFDEDIFSLLESFLKEEISERNLVDRLKDLLIAAAELVYEDHYDN
jgi:ferritin